MNPWELDWAKAPVQMPADVLAPQHQQLIDDRLLDALRQVESGGGKYLRSEAGALGPYQLMPATAREMGVDPMDEKQSREAARKILEGHLARFGDLDQALMAYHAGAGNVGKHLAGQPSGVGPRTKAYPGKIWAAFDAMGGTRSKPAPVEAEPVVAEAQPTEISPESSQPSRLRQVVNAAGNLIVPSAQAAELPPSLRATPKPEFVTGHAAELRGPWDLYRSGAAKPPPPAQRTIVDTVLELPGEVKEGFNRIVLGEGRREEGIPELRTAAMVKPDGSTDMAFGRLIAKMGLAADDAGKLDLYKEVYPKALSRKDKWGNVIVRHVDGKEYYFNDPGISGQDVDDLATGAMFTVPSARVGGALLSGAGKAGKVVGAGIGAGGGSIAHDKTAQAAGSKQPVDWDRVVINMAAAAGGEALVPAAARKIGRMFRSQPELYSATTGRLTNEGRELLRKAGLDPDQITDEVAQHFSRLAADAADPRQVAIVAEADKLPVPVRMTKGQVTDSPSERMFETQSRRGAYGKGAETVMRGVESEQQAQLRGNIPGIQDRIAGGQRTVLERGEGGAAAQSKLVTMRGTEKKAVDAAYDAARETRAGIKGEGIGELRMRVWDKVAADHNLEGLPRTQALLKELDQFSPEKDTASSVRQIFAWRQRVNNAARAGGEDSVALGKIKGELDGFLNEAIDRALLEGDESAIAAFKAANQANRDFAARFKGGDLVERLVEINPRAGKMQLTVPPEQATNVIFGSPKLFGGTNTGRDLARLKELLGPDSPEWKAIREEAWLRLARQAEGAINTDGQPMFSGAKFARALDKTLEGGPETKIMRTLFADDELALMQQFKRVAARATIEPPGGVNWSNTSAGLSNMVTQAFALMGEGAAAKFATLPVFRMIKERAANWASQGRAGYRPAKKPDHPGRWGGAATEPIEDGVEAIRGR